MGRRSWARRACTRAETPALFYPVGARARFSVQGIAVMVSLTAGPVWAQTHESVDEDYSRASRLRRDHRPEEALVIYQRLYDLTRASRAQGQLGITEAQMGRWVRAEEHLVGSLAEPDHWVGQHRRDLESALESVRANVTDLVVACNVAGATLRIDGTALGTLPRTTPVRVPLGPVVIDVVADHYEPHRRTVQMTARPSRVEVTLVAELPAAATPPAREAPPVAAPTPLVARAITINAAAPEGPAVSVVPPPPPAPTGGLVRTLAWAGLTSGAALVIAGAVAHAYRESQVNGVYNAEPCSPTDTQTRSLALSRHPLRAEHRSDGEHLSGTALVAC
ncbi:MAG: PEGA domain-containing protein [Deltaproteobacteria bacterium]|nr:PEGA domain-containing protein [Deltaproteobacteria bacterium]